MGELRLSYLLNAVLYACAGVAVFFLAFAIVTRMSSYHVWKEVVEEKNLALAILLGAISIGLCIIISSAVH